MQFSVPIFLIVLFLGVVQLAVGVVFGRLLPIRSADNSKGQQPDASALRSFGRRLFELVHRAADDVGEHRLEIEQASEDLATGGSGDPQDTAEFVLRSVARVVEINERLQSRLAATEEKLQEQTRQIEALYSAKRGGRDCGFRHDGQRWRPIEPGRAAEHAAGPLGESHAEPAEMAAICTDLRDRLASMMDRRQ